MNGTQVAVGYVRVSTMEQTNGFGLEVQRDTIRRWALDNAVPMLAIYEDHGHSGSEDLDKRDGLAAALARVGNDGDANILVVPRLDRLARDLILQESLISRIEQGGGRVVSVAEPMLDGTHDPTRVLIRQVLGALAQYERALIRGRLLAGARLKKARGGYASGAPPYGWRALNKELVPVPAEQRVIQLIVAMHEAGNGLTEIAEELNRRGIPTKRGTEWFPATVRRILVRAYRGFAVPVAS